MTVYDESWMGIRLLNGAEISREIKEYYLASYPSLSRLVMPVKLSFHFHSATDRLAVLSDSSLSDVAR